MSHSEPAIKITDIRTVGVPFTDQDRALEFYVATLGFEKRLDVPMRMGRRWIEVAPPGAATTIALVHAHEGVPAGVETGIRFTTPDADALHKQMRARGVDADEVLRWEACHPCSRFATKTATASRSSRTNEHDEERIVSRPLHQN